MGKAASAHLDPPSCREDLVRKAAASDCWYDFDWINDREALRVTSDSRNQGLTASEIKDFARDWINQGGRISCVPETREGYRDRRHFHYDITIANIPGFSRGLYVYMEICSADEQTPSVNLLNAHPPST